MVLAGTVVRIRLKPIFREQAVGRRRWRNRGGLRSQGGATKHGKNCQSGEGGFYELVSLWRAEGRWSNESIVEACVWRGVTLIEKIIAIAIGWNVVRPLEIESE